VESGTATATELDEEGLGAWEAYMNASRTTPFQEIQRQHNYANIRQAFRIAASCFPRRILKYIDLFQR
jgi:hypothetical protein